jgi:hypothetical protein
MDKGRVVFEVGTIFVNIIYIYIILHGSTTQKTALNIIIYMNSLLQTG